MFDWKAVVLLLAHFTYRFQSVLKAEGKKNQQGAAFGACQAARCNISRPQDACLWWKQEPVHCKRGAIQINGFCCQIGTPRNVSTTPVFYVCITQSALQLLTSACTLSPVILIAEIQDGNSICGTGKSVPPAAIPQPATKGLATWHNPSTWCYHKGVSFSQVWYQWYFFTISLLNILFCWTRWDHVVTHLLMCCSYVSIFRSFFSKRFGTEDIGDGMDRSAGEAITRACAPLNWASH